MMDVARRRSIFVPEPSGTDGRNCKFRRMNIFPLAILLLASISLSACVSDLDRELGLTDDPPDPAPAVAETAVPPVPDSVPPHPATKTQARARKEEHRVHRVVRTPDRQPANPPEKLASIEPQELIGQGPSGVAKLLGVPSSASQRDVSLIWTYSSTDCAFQVYFYPDIKTSLWHALQYTSIDKNGGAVDPSKLCIQRILAERGNGAD